MNEFIGLSFLINLMYATIGYIGLRFVLNNLDKAIGFNFKEWFEYAGSTEKSIYLSSRFIGTCIYFAAMLG